jgi:drug/metabolite transporter (DMT)-like permease
VNAGPAAIRRAGLALAVFGAIGFAGKAIIIKLAYRHGVDAVTLLALRMACALPLFAVLAWWAGRGRAPLTGRDWRVAATLGFLGYYLASFLDFAGLQYVTASLERLILYLNPTVVLLLGWLLHRQRVSRGQLLALGVSYCGILVAFAHEIRIEGGDVALGSALVFASTLSYSLYLVLSGQEVRRLGALRLTGLASTVACVLCVLQFLVLRPVDTLWALAPAVWWLSLLNALLCTVAPVLMVMMAVERIGAAAAAQAGMIGPVVTLLLGAALLGEPLTVWVVAGTALVLVGVALLARRPASR